MVKFVQIIVKKPGYYITFNIGIDELKMASDMRLILRNR
jgi:hypothetical protein